MTVIMDNLKILLASKSPRRRELLEQLGLNYKTLTIEVDETVHLPILPENYVKKMAEEKAFKALSQCDIEKSEGQILLSADTALSYHGKILGKPRDRADFNEMMHLLSNRTHTVFSAITLVGLSAGRLKFVSMLNESRVSFSILPQNFIDHYWESGEPCDKAGGYAIQGKMAGFIRNIEGSYSGVMGLPLFELREALEEFGYYLKG